MGFNEDPTFSVATGVDELGAVVDLTGDKTVALCVMALIGITSTLCVVTCMCDGLEVFISVLERDILNNCFPLLKFRYT